MKILTSVAVFLATALCVLGQGIKANFYTTNLNPTVSPAGVILNDGRYVKAFNGSAGNLTVTNITDGDIPLIINGRAGTSVNLVEFRVDDNLGFSITAGGLASGSGAGLTALNASQLTTGTVPDGRFPATYPAGSGVNLTALNAAQLTSGKVPTAVLPINVVTNNGALTKVQVGNGARGVGDTAATSSQGVAGDGTAITFGTGLNLSAGTLTASGGLSGIAITNFDTGRGFTNLDTAFYVSGLATYSGGLIVNPSLTITNTTTLSFIYGSNAILSLGPNGSFPPNGNIRLDGNTGNTTNSNAVAVGGVLVVSGNTFASAITTSGTITNGSQMLFIGTGTGTTKVAISNGVNGFNFVATDGAFTNVNAKAGTFSGAISALASGSAFTGSSAVAFADQNTTIGRDIVTGRNLFLSTDQDIAVKRTDINGGEVDSGTLGTVRNWKAAGYINNSVSVAVGFTLTVTNSTVVSTGVAQTMTLPTAVGIRGRRYTVKGITATTIATTSAQTIDVTTPVALLAGQSRTYEADDSGNWVIVSGF